MRNRQNHLLYYPSFLPPSEQWAKDTLLFWDDIASIVPKEHLGELRVSYLQVLTDLGLFTPIDPRRSLERDWSIGAGIELELEKRLQSPDVQRALANCDPSDSYHISVAKVTYGAGELLRSSLVSAEHKMDWFPIGEWVAVKRPAAIIYMSLLADRVAQVEGFQPGTDSGFFEDQYLGTGGHWPAQPTLRVALDGVIPTISREATFTDILRFREKHTEELLAFRMVMADLQGHLNGAVSSEDACEAIAAFEQRVRAAALRFDRLMETERLKGLTGTVSAVFSISTPSIVTALVGLGIGSLVNPGVAILSASAGFVAGGSIKVAEQKVARRERNDRLIDHPMSYVFQAAREL